MTRGRTALPPAGKVGPDFVGKTPADQALVEAEANKRVTTLAQQLNYSGALTPDAFEDIVYTGMRHSVQGALETGVGLLLMKESSGHGYFLERLQAHGIEERMAQRFMSAALKFSNTTTSSLLKAAGNQSKLLELLVLDDESIETLESGGSVCDINLDKIDRMGVRELRKALRDAKADGDIVRENIAKADDRVRKAEYARDKAARVWRAAQPDEQRQTLEQAVQQAANGVRDAIGMGDEPTGLSGAVHALAQHAAEHSYDATALLGDVFARLLVSVQVARDDELLPIAIPHHEISVDDWRNAH